MESGSGFSPSRGEGLETGLSLSLLALVIAAVYIPIGAVRKQFGSPDLL